MARLVHFQPCSLDLRIADEDGDSSWAEPSEAVHALANGVARSIGTRVHGRRMRETMRCWEPMPDEDSATGDFGRIRRGADEVVVSGSLDEGDAADPHRREEDAQADPSTGGARPAAAALTAGPVDEIHLLLAPVVGPGPRALPNGLRIDTVLVEQRELHGWTSLRHRVRRAR